MAKNQPAAKGPARTRHRRAKRSSRAVASNSTPSSYHQKISSTLGTDKCPKQFSCPVLDAVLARELQNSQFTMVPQLVETLFPEKTIPVAIREELPTILNQLYNNGRWEKFPTDLKSDGAEQRLAGFFNRIMTAMTSLPGCPNTYHARVWTGDYCNLPLKGSGPKHKPDLILVDRIKRAKTWNDVNALAELTTSLSFTQIIRKTLVSKSYLIFKAQEDRRYVITVAICGTKFYLSLFDRAGVCHSQGLDINDDAEKFLLVLVGLSFTSRTWLGYDPTIISHLNGAREVLVTKT